MQAKIEKGTLQITCDSETERYGLSVWDFNYLKTRSIDGEVYILVPYCAINLDVEEFDEDEESAWNDQIRVPGGK